MLRGNIIKEINFHSHLRRQREYCKRSKDKEPFTLEGKYFIKSKTNNKINNDSENLNEESFYEIVDIS